MDFILEYLIYYSLKLILKAWFKSSVFLFFLFFSQDTGNTYRKSICAAAHELRCSIGSKSQFGTPEDETRIYWQSLVPFLQAAVLWIKE